MAYKFQFGQAILSGNLDQEGDVDVLDGGVLKMNGTTAIASNRDATLAGVTATTLGHADDTDLLTLADQSLTIANDASLTYKGTGITSTGAELNLVDGSQAGTVVNNKAVIYSAGGNVQGSTFAVPDDGTIGNGSNADALTLAAAEITVKDGVDFSVATVGGFNYGGAAVTSTAAELNLVDGAQAGTQVASKAVIYDASRGINAHGLTGSLRFSLDVAPNGGVGMTPFNNSSDVNDLKISGSFMPSGVGIALADDSFVGLSVSGTVKSFTAAAYATAIAGDGLGASSGVLSVGVDDSSIEINSDSLRVKAGGVTDAMLNDDVASGLAGDGLAASSGVLSVGVDDSSIEINSDSLRVKAAGVTDAMLNDDVATGLAGDGLAATSGVMKLDINELSAASVDVAADSIAIVDADDSNLSRKESIADLVAAMAGGGLSASDGVLSTQGGNVSQSFEGKTLVEGYNYLTGTLGANKLILPPNPSIGDVIVIKAGDLAAGKTVTVSASATHTVDGVQRPITLESPFAAVSCVLTRTASWSIV